MSSSGGGDDDPPPQQPLVNHRTTTSILRQAATSSTSILPSFLLLSLLLFSFRSLVVTGSVYVSSLIDRDPYLRSLLHSLSSFPSPPPPPSAASPRHRHRPFLHLTRVGTLDDDFFSGDDDLDGSHHRSLFRFHHPNPHLNSSHLLLSDFTHHHLPSHFKFHIQNSTHEVLVVEKIEEESVALSAFRVFVSGLELGRPELVSVLYLFTILSIGYGWVVIAFVITYSWTLGIVFVSVVNDLLGRYISFSQTIWDGSSLGVKRLSGFILMRWAVKDALTQILGLWFFGEIRDHYSFFKLFLRLKLMPFSVSLPWLSGYEKEVLGFLVAWFLVDTLLAFVFAVDPWVTIAATRRSGREIVKEGCYLLATMIPQCVQLKCLELVLCGAFTRWVLTRLFGRSFSVLLQSLVEVYFIVAWLIFYFAARSKDANLSGRTLGRRELEGLVGGLR